MNPTNSEQKEITQQDCDDPRLSLPSLSLIAISGLFFMEVLNLIPLCLSAFVEFEVLVYVQYALAVTVILWALSGRSNRKYFFKAINKGRQGVATLVDKFMVERSGSQHNSKSSVLIYEFEALGDNGETKKVRAKHYCYSGSEYQIEIGTKMTYFAFDNNNKLAAIAGIWPETWYTGITPENFKKFQKRFFASSLRLSLVSALVLFGRSMLIGGDVMSELPAVWFSLGLGLIFVSINAWQILTDRQLPKVSSEIILQKIDIPQKITQLQESEPTSEEHTVLTESKHPFIHFLLKLDKTISEQLKTPAKSKKTYDFAVVGGVFMMFFGLAAVFNILSIPLVLTFPLIVFFLFLWGMYFRDRSYYCDQDACTGIAHPIISESVKDKTAWSAKLNLVGHRCSECNKFTKMRGTRHLVS